ncbi:MAG TPA: exodeoxyribonuclease VII small subunit [Candidatus Hydrogenedentes bacterium]|nr:exodeoxyribonuclease VII small subunit [Candidatus Hydrogenedentota bacterium]
MAEPKFEKDLEKLEEIVAALEEGELPLDDALKRFEEGIKLAKRCEKALADAEKKIEILTKNADGKLEAQPFDEEEPETGPTIRKHKKQADDSDGDEKSGSLLF